MTASRDREHLLSVDELETHLRRQVGYLRRSAETFDAGAADEAFRLAATVRVLCHHTERGHSLLHQLGLLPDRLWFVDTSMKIDVPPGGFAIGAGLGTMRMDFDAGTVTPTALLDDLDAHRINPPRTFDQWWNTAFLTNESPLLGSRARFTYSRRDVVLGMANKDGGAHVDPRLPQHYRALTDHDAGMSFVVSGRPVTISRYAFATAWMRQIAHEVQRTLERDFRTQAILEGRPSGLAPGG